MTTTVLLTAFPPDRPASYYSGVDVVAFELRSPRGIRRCEAILTPGVREALDIPDGAALVCSVQVAHRDRPLQCLYLAEIEGVGVKVGISAKPKKRLAQHAQAAAAFGRRVQRVWLSEPHVAASVFEDAIKGGHHTEYLPISFEEALQRVSRVEAFCEEEWGHDIEAPLVGRVLP